MIITSTKDASKRRDRLKRGGENTGDKIIEESCFKQDTVIIDFLYIHNAAFQSSVQSKPKYITNE